MIEHFLFYIISGAILFIHSSLNFHLAYLMSDGRRIHWVFAYIIALFNAIVAPYLLMQQYPSPMFFYFIATLALSLENFILFKGKFSLTMGVTLGSNLHLFVLRAIIIAAISMSKDITMLEIFNCKDYTAIVAVAPFLAQLITLTLFITLMPLKVVKTITNNKSFYSSLFALTAFLTLYLTCNAYMFKIDYASDMLAIQEILIAITVLSFFYVMILLLIRIFNLGLYKEKSKTLETKINRNKVLTFAVESSANSIIELNCTQNKIERILYNAVELKTNHLPSIEEFFSFQAQKFTHSDDINKINSITADSLIADFKSGIKVKSYEFRSKRVMPSTEGNEMLTLGEEYYWYQFQFNIQEDVDSGEIYAVLIMTEIHDEKEKELALRQQAEKDSLTGAYNRNAFSTKLNKYLQFAGQGSLYMIDLDNFKNINDNMGHSVGDTVLCELHEDLSSLFRSQDLIGRTGGDEFVLFLKDTIEPKIIKEKAKRICEKLQKSYYTKENKEIVISASVGVAIAPKHGSNFKVLFNAADIAMYKSKNKGKNTFTIFTKSMDKES